ncbi:unnamed protein product [Rotaria socialis]|uniref:Nose resistant-to-fluoxetine protein N-terminal domain-containing protein n=1 Tax=Rotaria socialis TaxID=392032 RepID=A0A820N2D0_9BILA|nr:unnamed protein product [Rotaria socialis]CAF4382432.1 unnamed protein product [Rotaria socialis]
MVAVLLPVLLLVLSHSTIGEPTFETIPLRFESVIQRLREFYQNYPDIVNDLVNNPFAKIRPELLLNNRTSSQNQSSDCERDLEILISAASQRQLWALKVLDAWGKPLPSGILKGNIFWLGNYDECLNPLYQINNKSFLQQPINTQYCALQSVPGSAQGITSSGITLGLCLPTSCNRQSIITLIQEILNVSSLNKNNLHCSNDRANEQHGPSSGTIALIIVLSFLVLLVFIGTIADIFLQVSVKPNEDEKSHSNGYHNLSEESSNKNVPVNSVYPASQYMAKPMPSIVFLAEFSAVRTLGHIFAIDKKENENSFVFLNGIRVLSLFWVILGHSFFFGLSYMSNILDLLSASRNFAFQLITSGVFSVDTFFLLTGFLTAVLFVRHARKEKLSLRMMILYYVHRYVRLTPTFILVMFVSIYLTPYFGQGPLFPVQQGFESTGCRNGGWWTSFLYIGNFFKSENMCLSVTWYLFNDMQFHWIAPLALIPFVMKQRAIGYIMTILFVLVSIGSILSLLLFYPSMVTHALDISSNATGPNFFDKIYQTPWCRISPYAFGLLTGFVVVSTGRNYRLNTIVRVIGNILATVLGLVCIFSTYGDYILVPGLSRASLVAYQVLSRVGWSMSISWLIFICSINQGGIVNRILSFSIWTPLARLNYAAYLIHSTVIFVTYFNQSAPLYYQTMTSVNSFVSILCFSYLAAVVVVIFFETPFFVLEKKFLKR